ncbi:MAG: glutamate ligase domain-containing protein, partial [Acidobacteriota bacterium]
MGCFSQTTAVFSILADKDIAGVAAAMQSRIDHWLIAPSGGARGATVARIKDAVLAAGVDPLTITDCADVAAALALAYERSGEADRIVVFGSFVTVASALRALERSRQPGS